MNVGILTFHGVPNVGAYLQCASLSAVLRKLGNDVEVIDYSPPQQHLLCYPKTSSEVLRILSRPRRLIGGVRSLVNSKRHIRAARRDINSLPLGVRLTDGEALSNLKYDRIILGSDEIWNLNNPIMDQDMSYAGIHFRSDQLCAYAPSFGSVNDVDDIPEEMAGALARIRYLSARDQNSVDLLAGLGLQATLAVDPTLLERRVEVASSQNHSGNQVVIYGAPIGGEFLKALDQMAKRQRFEMSSIVYSQGSRVAHKPGVRADEFLRLFREARAVVTTTFHGTIFAILSGKPFAVVNAGAKINKISGLLKMFDAENRLVRDLDSLEDLLSQPLDAETVNAQLEKASAQSMEFLQNALN